MATTTWKLQLGTAIAALLLVSGLVLRVSAAAFSATTDNPSNSWATGSIALTDDDGDGGAASAMFDVSGMLPTDEVEHCIVVTYEGALDPAAVKLYADVTDSGLADHLDVVVEEGTGGGYADCTGFTADGAATVTKTLTAFDADHNAYANGAGVWNPTADGQSKTYKFTVTLGSDTPDTAQGASATATFTWETTT